jgi:hypothetical protein
LKQLESKQVLRRAAHGGLGGGNLGVLGPGDVSSEIQEAYAVTAKGRKTSSDAQYQQTSYSVGTAPAGSRTYSAAQILNRAQQ